MKVHLTEEKVEQLEILLEDFFDEDIKTFQELKDFVNKSYSMGHWDFPHIMEKIGTIIFKLK